MDCTLYSRCNAGFKRTYVGKVLTSSLIEQELRLLQTPWQGYLGNSVENSATGKLVEREVSRMREFGVLTAYL